MECIRKISEDLFYVGGSDHHLSLFENMHPIPHGISYNSYVLLDEKTVLFDTVDWSITRQFLENIEYVLAGRSLDYLIINHMEPDHCASIEEVILRYPNVMILSTEKSFLLMRQFNFNIDNHEHIVKEGDTICFGKHTISFIEAPMVHWPEAMVSYDLEKGILFSADAFGSFGALHGKLFQDEMDYKRDWINEARRYYTNIVGKYGPHVNALLKKVSMLNINMICPLHGPIWRGDFEYLFDKYQHWASYESERKGVLIVYASMYGNTEQVANIIANQFVEKGIKDIAVYDVSHTHVSYLIADAFQYSHIVLASVTYNLGIYPPMSAFLNDMKALHVQNRIVGIIENGSWALTSGSLMKTHLQEMKSMSILHDEISIASSTRDVNRNDINAFVQGVIDSMK